MKAGSTTAHDTWVRSLRYDHLGLLQVLVVEGRPPVIGLARPMNEETNETRVERLVLEYAQTIPDERPLGAGLALREHLGIESLALVSLVLRLADELGVNVIELGVELGNVKTVGDLVGVAQELSSSSQERSSS